MAAPEHLGCADGVRRLEVPNDDRRRAASYPNRSPAPTDFGTDRRIRAPSASLCHAHGMDDRTILSRISELVDEEHRLRAQAQSAQIGTDEEQDRLRELENSLDQCWDLLRRRRAARDNGDDPDAAGGRPESEVRRYLQ